MRYIYSTPQTEVSPGIELFTIIDQMRPCDVLAIPDVTHVAMNWRDLGWILHLLEQRTARLEVRTTTRKSGEPAEAGFKRDLLRAAVQRAQIGGRYKVCGRKRRIDRDAIRKLIAAGKPPRDIATEMGVSLRSIYRARDVA